LIIYVSAPYTLGNLIINVKNACEAGNLLLDKGHVPLIPHLMMLWELHSPKPYSEWMRICLALLGKCDALLRLEGFSKGADIEVKIAKEAGIPVYFNLQEVPNV